MVIVKYRVNNNNKTLSENDFFEKVEFIKKILTDKRGWLKYDYEFKEVSSNEKGKVLDIYFLSNEELIKCLKDESLKNLSAYNPNNHSIYFNLYNWDNGPWGEYKFPENNEFSSIELYRIYVINHEVGHALGLHHPKSKENNPVSVMEQNTKGLEFLNRNNTNKNIFVRDYQWWPQNKLILDEERASNSNKLWFKGIIKGGKKIKLCSFINITVLVIILIIFFIKLVRKLSHSNAPIKNL